MIAALAIVIWAFVALLLAPKFVKLRFGSGEVDNIYIKWLVLFLLPILLVVILAFAGVIVVASMSIVGLILLLLPLIILVAYFTVGVNFNGKKYRFRR